MNGELRYMPQWQEKIGWRLFPQSHVALPEVIGTSMEGGRGDCLVTEVTCHLSLLDRFRTLISGKIKVTSKTVTENTIGGNITASGVSVLPPKFLERTDIKQ